MFRAALSHKLCNPQPFNLLIINEEIQKYLDICFIDISEEILYPIIISHIMEHHKSLSLKPVKVEIWIKNIMCWLPFLMGQQTVFAQNNW